MFTWSIKNCLCMHCQRRIHSCNAWETTCLFAYVSSNRTPRPKPRVEWIAAASHRVFPAREARQWRNISETCIGGGSTPAMSGVLARTRRRSVVQFLGCDLLHSHSLAESPLALQESIHQEAFIQQRRPFDIDTITAPLQVLRRNTLSQRIIREENIIGKSCSPSYEGAACIYTLVHRGSWDKSPGPEWS